MTFNSYLKQVSKIDVDYKLFWSNHCTNDQSKIKDQIFLVYKQFIQLKKMNGKKVH